MDQGRTEATNLVRSPDFQTAVDQMVEVIAKGGARLQGVRSAATPELSNHLKVSLGQFQKDRGRELFFPFLASGLGNGPFVELEDGSVKYDMITGIGIHFFGHSHPELIKESLLGAASDIYQGNLQPGHEAPTLLRALLSRVEKTTRLRHGWITTCGTMANEIALKIIRQKKFPASKIVAFEHCFSGRSTAMQEITDNAKYREGQPTYGEALYIPFYQPGLGLEASVRATLTALESHVARHPGRIAALMIEPVQGEGGFNHAPREYYAAVLDAARKAGLAIWLDEIQSFGRTGELFAFQTFALDEYVDVVTAAKMLHASVVLFSEDYNPRPGLVAGTFSGTSSSLRVARRIVELLDEGYLGPNGRIAALSRRFSENLEKLATGTCRGLVGERRALGGMIAFEPFGGTLPEVKATLMALFDLGVVAFYCGHGPYLVRLLPPFGVMTERQVDEVCGLIEKALLKTGGRS